MLFRPGEFTSSAGILLPYKIECDHLTDDDLATLAGYAAKKLPHYGVVFGVPRGGDRLARFFRAHAAPWSNRPLVVDDVWTTGKNMMYYSSRIVLDKDWIGCVLFARSEGVPTPPNVYPIFKASL